MDVFQNVLDTIMEVFNMIKDFFMNLLGMVKGDNEETTAAN